MQRFYPNIFWFSVLLLIFVVATEPTNAQSDFSAKSILQAAREFAEETLGADADLEVLAKVQDQHFSHDGVSAQFRESAGTSGNAFNVVVEFTLNDRVIRQVSVPFRVNRTVLVPVASRKIPSGAILSNEDVRYERRAITIPKGKIASDVLGKRSNKPMREGTMILSEDLVSARGIVKGQAVSLVVRSGAITIKTQGKALANAQPGEAVAVIRDGATSPIQAKVIGDGIVEVIGSR